MIPGKMEFRDFYYAIPVKDRPAFAGRVDSTVGYLNLLASGHKNCGEALAMRIERESNGKVRVESLCPSAPWDVIRGADPAEPARAA
jgi:DNA-binding transcriptional regulator YdaS (Cro superfamily)